MNVHPDGIICARIFALSSPEHLTFAAQHLQALLDANLQVVGVYTQPTDRLAEGNKLTPKPSQDTGAHASDPVFQPVNFARGNRTAGLKVLEADLMIVVAYGLLLPQVILDTPVWVVLMCIAHCYHAGVEQRIQRYFGLAMHKLADYHHADGYWARYRRYAAQNYLSDRAPEETSATFARKLARGPKVCWRQFNKIAAGTTQPEKQR